MWNFSIIWLRKAITKILGKRFYYTQFVDKYLQSTLKGFMIAGSEITRDEILRNSHKTKELLI